MAAPMNSRCISCYNYSLSHVINSAKVLRSSSRLVSDAASSRKDAVIGSTDDKDSKGFRRYQMKKFGDIPMERKGSRFTAMVKPIAPRYTKMPVNQDWTNVWPTAQTFKWSVVPLPLKQGYLKNKMEAAGDGLPPQKRGNTELIKIPNFLHLTPKHIEKHCKAIKKFCTEWPSELDTVKDMDYHFPLEVITEDYCFSSPSVRDPRARTVTFKFKASDLEMDSHARDKWQKLLKSRDDKVTLKADRCPLRKQNYDYLQYLLTALYFESWKVEPWEAEMTQEDMLDYSWDLSHSKTNVVNIINKYREKDQTIEDPTKRRLPYVSDDVSPDTVTSLEPVKEYKQSVEELNMTGENITTINNYKESVLKLLNVQTKSNNSS